MILHVDMDAFYASVELRDRPELAGKPVVVGGSPKSRGVISAASYEARKFGVHSAMPSSQAIRNCPQLILIPPRMNHYAAISKQIRGIFSRFTSLVEPLSLDEAFLDVSGCEKLFGDGPTIGHKIKKAISDELDLVASVGVAPNKFIAKVASDLDKPDGFVIVKADEIEPFLAPLSITRVWGIGPKTELKFTSLGVETIGQLRRLPRTTLDRTFGNHGEHFWRLARGIDPRHVVPDRIAKSVSHETTFSTDIDDDGALEAWLHLLTDQVARRIRRQGIFARTVQIKVRFAGFHTLTRSQTLTGPSAPSQTTQDLWEAAIALLRTVRNVDRRSVRLIGMGASSLTKNKKRQQHLFGLEEQTKAIRLDEAADSIREKFGNAAVQRASTIEHRIGFRVEPKNDK